LARRAPGERVLARARRLLARELDTVATDTHKPEFLTIALFVAAAAHALVILGVSFSPVLEEMRTPPALEVILVQQRDREAPVEAEYLAQSSQDGGGRSDENARPSAPFASMQDLDTDGVAPNPVLAGAPASVEAANEEILTSVYSETSVASDAKEEEIDDPDLPEATVLVEQNLDIARLQAEIDRQQEEFAKRPKIKTVNARTTESSSAEYMYRWVEQVERVGNLNYPDEARRRQLAGALVLIVGIHKNGEIESVTVDESSGHRVLDDAARRIVELAGPFDPMTGKLAAETDILYIVRTWEFKSGDEIVSY